MATKPEGIQKDGNTAASPKLAEGGTGNKVAPADAQGTKVAADVNRKSVTQAKDGKTKKKRNGCQKCCGKIMSLFAHDAIYGSFVGPHPVSFLFFCALFKKKCPCTKNCSKPLCVASIATKIMNFIMLGIVTCLAGFFIIPWPMSFLSSNSTHLSSFYPCQNGKMIKNRIHNGGCFTHAGYFMAYRCFCAYATAMITNCFIMMGVSSTQEDRYRARIHHGFWLYKYLYLIILLLIYFLMVDGERDPEGVFELTASIVGNIAHMAFSLIEITFVMDLVELWVYENKTGKKKWAHFIYCTVTFLVLLGSFLLYIRIWVDFSSKRVPVDANGTMTEWPPWPADNCLEGERRYPDWKHTGLILGSTGVIMILIIVMAFARLFAVNVHYPYTGWLQISVMILINLVYLWSALTNSSNIHSRPHCNVGLDVYSNPRNFDDYTKNVIPGAWDQYYGQSGFFHGLVCLLALVYYAFIHGPRSNTAPLSLLYCHIFQIADRIPVYPDENDAEMAIPIGYLQAISERKVWDDEQMELAQSWSHFYFMMFLGSLSLMMAMTNFTHPWAANHYNSSNVAFGCKFGTAVIATCIYIMTLISKCSSIHMDPEQKKRKRSVREFLEFNFEPSDFDDNEEEQSLDVDIKTKLNENDNGKGGMPSEGLENTGEVKGE